MLDQVLFSNFIHYKFQAQSRFFDAAREFDSYTDYIETDIRDGTFCNLVLPIRHDVLLVNAYGVEILTHRDCVSLTFIQRSGATTEFRVRAETGVARCLPSQVSLCLVATNDKVYKDLLEHCIEYYTALFAHFCHPVLEVEFCLVYFGKEFPLFHKAIQRKVVFSYEDFSMALARNWALSLATHPYTLMLDLDVYYSFDELVQLFDYYKEHCVSHVLSLQYYQHSRTDFTDTQKHYRTGNGLYFGETDVLRKNRYCEDFKKCFYEDTEYLMNFSRIGIVPELFFSNYMYVNHARELTHAYASKNEGLFEFLLKNGRQALDRAKNAGEVQGG